jgi:CRP/FNR family transcriptional regulator, anaerobic regulatory protein
MNIETYIHQFIDPDYKFGNLPFEIKEKTIRKNEVISDYNVIEQNMYFLQSGIVQVSIEANAETKILDFFFPGSFFCSYTSSLTQKPSDVQLLAISDCQVQIFKIIDLQNAYSYSLLANKLGRIETEKLYLKKVKREKDFLTKSAEERYVDILNDNPAFIDLIPVNKIAKYLGIQPESLSRIRKQK